MANNGIRTDGAIRMIAGERFTPFALAKKLDAKILFESSSFERGRSRYSLLVLDEAFRLIQRGADVLYRAAGGGEIPFAFAPARDILDAARHFADQHPRLHQDFPYPTGGFGFVGYEFAARCDEVRLAPKPDDMALDDAVFLFGHVHLIYDHHADVIYLHGVNYDEHEIDLAAALDRAERRIFDFDFNYMVDADARWSSRLVDDPDSEREFLEGVRAVKSDIEAGGLIQAVLSRRIEIETDRPSLESYRKLRSINPSPYMFHIDFGGFQAFGASPEMHVRMKEGRMTIKPLAGTRPRCQDPAENARREKELLGDEKERAEHVMLVDLARNDLGRVARTGSVEVVDFMSVERYSHVMHISSRIEADIDDGVSSLDAIRLSFPAGTVSGAPKIRAMETIDKLERHPRRFYAGIVGFIEPGGDFNTCIAIRSAVQRGRRLWLRAGAGIVFDSDPEKELAETNHKLDALLAAMDLDPAARAGA
ncbi:MAG: chorismate-binding protein [Planctomycetota bacterium]|jgi:anthranilate synthase component 1|nr:chorismate-binding protein [Planctomycetota bacterium]